MKLENCKTIKEYALVVSQHLHESGIDNILTGGACVSIYSNEKYKSRDLDFLIPGEVRLTDIKAALSELGFVEKDRVFLHGKIELSIDIIAPPLTVGEEQIRKLNEIREENAILKLLTPTDSVKDRLAAYFHWNDQQAFEQALMVCKDQNVDIDNIREWSRDEGMIEKFIQFKTEFDQLKMNIDNDFGLTM